MEKEEDVLNRIIAAGLNSMMVYPKEEDEALINLFTQESFKQIIACWPMLSSKVRFKIFESHSVAFEKYMRSMADNE